MIECKKSVEGFFRVEKLKEGEVVFDSGVQRNLVTNAGLDYWMMVQGEESPPIFESAPLKRIIIGSGNAEPTPQSTHISGSILGTHLENVPNASWVNDPVDGYYGRLVVTYNLPVGAVVGNASEISIGPSAVTSPPYNEAHSLMLIRDEGGNPTTITVLADEQLRVTWELRVYLDMAEDAHYKVTIGGVEHDVVMRPALLGYANALYGGTARFVTNTFGSYTDSARLHSTDVLAAKTDIPSLSGGSGVAFNAVTPAVYTKGNFYRDVTLHAGSADANFNGGIGSCVFGNFWGKYQMSFSPKIDKNNLKRLELTFRHSIARRA